MDMERLGDLYFELSNEDRLEILHRLRDSPMNVTRLAGEGDALAAQIVAEGGEALGVAVASMAMVLDIHLYVVGGGVAQAGDLLLDPARRTVPECSYPSVCRRVRIVTSALGDDGPILGCGWLARQLLRSAD